MAKPKDLVLRYRGIDGPDAAPIEDKVKSFKEKGLGISMAVRMHEDKERGSVKLDIDVTIKSEVKYRDLITRLLEEEGVIRCPKVSG